MLPSAPKRLSRYAGITFCEPADVKVAANLGVCRLLFPTTRQPASAPHTSEKAPLKVAVEIAEPTTIDIPNMFSRAATEAGIEKLPSLPYFNRVLTSALTLR